MENASLGDVLHRENGGAGLLDWQTGLTIAQGAAKGLSYLHQDCVPAIVYRDVKSNNILLDAEMVPRVADFGLAKTLQREVGGVAGGDMSRVAGSYGYIAPVELLTTFFSYFPFQFVFDINRNDKKSITSIGILQLTK
ncbi:hypothetical protein Q3G72_023723 [Acer saccharum]|nr:hypothetical protein Q3G72_023723 [Acer saccharum]